MLKTLTLAAIAMFGIGVAAGADAPDEPDAALGGVRDVIARQVPGWERYFRFALRPDTDDHDHFTVATDHGTVSVTANTRSGLLAGAGWYLKYGAGIQVSPNGAPLARSPAVVALPRPYTQRSSVIYRYALNQNTDGYTSPYWDWPQWRHELDIYALAGINTMLVERATEAVIARTFTQFGYTDEEIRAKLAMPAHLNWQLMGNLCCFGGPPSADLLAERIETTRHLLSRMRALGITPVLPGFYGMVPADFATRFPHAHVVDQGTWNSFQRPAWLDPRDPLFARIAQAYYQAQRDLFGDTSVYDLELFQEGGSAGDVPLKPAVAAIEDSLQRAHPGARWMILGWRQQPAREILEVVPHDRMFVVDLHQNAERRPDRGAELLGADYLYGGIWEYGGRTTLGGEAEDYGVRLPGLPATQPSLIGTAIFPESMDNNPYLFDLFSEAAWHDAPLDLPRWTRDFADRRYGRADANTRAAWLGLLRTVYAKRATLPGVRDEDDAAALESLFDAQPSLTARHVFHTGSTDIYYDFGQLQQALDRLLAAPKAFDDSSAYRYDVVDVTRQVIANQARVLLPKIRRAYDAKDLRAFDSLTALWLELMDMQDRLLGTEPFFRLGRWLSFVDAWPGDAAGRTQLSYDARSLLTSWGNRPVSDDGRLHDYANKDWQGLTRDYYRPRWQMFFDTLRVSLQSGQPPAQIDWYALADRWNRQMTVYSARPEGEARPIARQIVQFLEHGDETRVLR